MEKICKKSYCWILQWEENKIKFRDDFSLVGIAIKQIITQLIITIVVSVMEEKKYKIFVEIYRGF